MSQSFNSSRFDSSSNANLQCSDSFYSPISKKPGHCVEYRKDSFCDTKSRLRIYSSIITVTLRKFDLFFCKDFPLGGPLVKARFTCCFKHNLLKFTAFLDLFLVFWLTLGQVTKLKTFMRSSLCGLKEIDGHYSTSLDIGRLHLTAGEL